MPGRWSADTVLALAPDESSRRAAGVLGRPAPWTDTGVTGELVWGLCAGSGQRPYQTIVDLSEPAYKCSCPSRKFPCKHALGLLLLWSAGTVPDRDSPADFARAWQESRRDRASSRESKGAPVPGLRSDERGTSEGATREGTGLKRPEASGASRARRRAERAQRVASGLADLREWLRDQVRVGLAAGGVPTAGNVSVIAARMTDAQAPGVASRLRALPGVTRAAPRGAVPLDTGAGSGDEWPARLLSEYAMLHLLARAYDRVDTLPGELAAVVRSRVGHTTSRQEVLARAAVGDRWLVLATRDLTDGTVPGRRIWLRGLDTGRWAMLLTYAAPGGSWQDPDTARLRPGTELDAELHYYPGQPALRALIGQRHAATVPAKHPEPAGDIASLLTEWAAGLEADPWLTAWPVLLTGTPVPPAAADGVAAGRPWHLVDQAGNAVPLADRESLWTLLAISAGHQVTIGGEWHPEGPGALTALTVWHDDQAVPL
jgi:hypothetical protein